MRLVSEVRLAAPVSEAFAWHERPGAWARLLPPWERVEVLERSGTIRDGDRVALRVRLGPASSRWALVHREYAPGRSFVDVQVEGPFASWRHEHRFSSDGPAVCRLEDAIECRFPLGPLGRLGEPALRARLERLLAYRHRVVAADLERHAAFRSRGALKVAVTGASGLLGSALCAFLDSGGHRVLRLARAGRAGESVSLWDPVLGRVDQEALEGVDAVVHLSGENIGAGRWTAERKRRIWESREVGTRVLADALARLRRPPRVLVAASAIGYYGDRDVEVDETNAPGKGFLPELCEAWEAAAAPARGRGVRVVHLRLGVVLSPAGGALERMLTPFSLGLGGPVGSGRQPMSWISIDDAVGAVHRCLLEDSLYGPVNATAPGWTDNASFARTLGRVLGRPAVAPLPAPAVRALFGEMGEALLLGGAPVRPAKLLAAGFHFLHPGLEEALRHVLGRSG